MIYRGKLVDGKIVFDQPLPLPEGQEVEVEVRPLTGAQSDLAWLQQFQGIAKDLPPDASQSVDRLLYGQLDE